MAALLVTGHWLLVTAFFANLIVRPVDAIHHVQNTHPWVLNDYARQ